MAKISKDIVRYRSLRLAGYVIGFMLFYAPFDGFARFIDLFITPTQLYSIHEPCFRIPLHDLLLGNMGEAGPVSLIAFGLLLVVSLFFGPLFCGKLCPAGALPEYLSRLVPDRFKIDWPKHIPATPIRYGFFAGFLLAGVVGISEHCSYCNFYVFDLFVQTVPTGHLPVYSISLILTFLVWFFIMGIFTQGGRGFCNFLCPVGACSNLVHVLGVHIPWTWRLRVGQPSCVHCGRCTKVCPMSCLTLTDHALKLDRHRCILCQECQHTCPAKAISYGRGEVK